MISLPNARKSLNNLITVLSLSAMLAVAVVAQVTQKVDKATQTEPPVPKSIVRGRVIYDDTERPVRRAPISLVQLPDRGQLSSVTDRNGRFAIADVPAGIYFAFVDSPGIITPLAFVKFTEKGPPASWNVKEIKEYCTEIVADGTNNLEVTIRAHRGGAVSGQVTYGDGSPAVNAEVGVIRRNGKQSVRVVTGVSAAALLSLHTDDRGMYRIAGVPPGEYIVSAAETNTSPDKQQGRNRSDPFGDFFKNDALASTYYGGTNRLTEAVSLQVEAGAEMNNIDITLPETTPHTISGSVIAKLDGRILPGATLTVRNKEQVDWFLRGEQQFQANSEGQWMLTGVPDGAYLISVEPPYNISTPDMSTTQNSDSEEEPTPKKPARRFVKKETEITVAGSDVGGIAIELAEGASISGVVEMPAELKEAGAGYVMVRCAYDGESSSEYENSGGAYDGTFNIESLRAGKVYLNAEITIRGIRDDESAKYYVKSITHNGIDLMRQPLTIEAGQQIANVKIVVAADLARVNLQLLDNRGKPVAARPVMVLPVEPSRWSFSGNVRNASDLQGMIAFAGAPGDYLVIVGGIDDSWPPSLEVIRARAETGLRIKLQSGDNRTITITVP